MHTSAHCFKMDNQLLWPQYYKQEWLSVKTNREERKGAATHIWFEKEEARMSFLGNQVQIKKREKRKHVCGYWRGLCVHVCLCVFIMCLHALCICACAQLQGCVCVSVCVCWSECLWFYHLQWLWQGMHAVDTNNSLRLERVWYLCLYRTAEKLVIDFVHCLHKYLKAVTK